MQRFTDIRRLDLTTPFFYPDDEEAHDSSVLDEELLSAIDPIHFNHLLSSMNLDSLHSLTLDWQCLSGIPVRILSNLKELSVCITTECDPLGLDLLFRHALLLESLTFYGFIGPEAFPSFIADSSSLPSLHSFRFSCDKDTMHLLPDPEVLNIFFKFIRERTNLRRLYLRIPSLNLFHECDYHIRLLETLKHLEVFGFHTGYTAVDTQFLQSLCQHLPKRLKAFHLAMEWCGDPLLFLVSPFSSLPSLPF
jgi:hypothetical protein